MPNSPEQPGTGASDASWTIAVSGSTGLIGSALIASLRADGHRVRRLVRSQVGPRSEHITWNPASGTLDAQALAGVDGVVHLAGENVGERWTSEKKRKIRESRVQGTRLLAAAVAALDAGPKVMVSASGVGIYGDRGDELLDEQSPLGPGTDFMAEVGRAWEASADPAERHGVRVVNTRFGMIVSAQGGALDRMLLPFRLGVGGRLGSGRQWMSWVALEDAIAAIRFTLFEDALRGPVNVVSPQPVTNAEFTRVLGRVLRRPAVMVVPAFGLRLVYGEMADAAVLASQRTYPRRLLDAGFRFRYPELEAALRAELRAENN